MSEHGTYDLVMGVYNGVELEAPVDFWKIPDDAFEGGCGPGKYGDLAVPDSFYFLNMRFCCLIHDIMYAEGKTEHDKVIADRTFLDNMLAYIEAKSANAFMIWLREGQALKYYQAVRWCGHDSFWHDKVVSA